MPSEKPPARWSAARLEPHLAEDLVDPARGDGAERGEGAEMVAGGASRMHASGVEHRADDVVPAGAVGCS